MQSNTLMTTVKKAKLQSYNGNLGPDPIIQKIFQSIESSKYLERYQGEVRAWIQIYIYPLLLINN